MKVTRYFVVSYMQMFTTSLMVGVIAAALIIINTSVKEYMELPIVHQQTDGSCKQVSNFRNGDAYTCQDVNVILRKFRTVND